MNRRRRHFSTNIYHNKNLIIFYLFIIHRGTQTKDIMSSRKLRGKPKLGSTPSSDDCDKDEHLLGLSAKDIDDTLVCLDDETLTSA